MSIDGNTVFDTAMVVNHGGYNITLGENILPADTGIKKTSDIALPDLTFGTWTLHNAVDSTKGDWSNSTLKFISQKETAGGLILSGMFTWRRNSILMGTEQIKGRYTDKNRVVKLKGEKLSSVTDAGKRELALGSYTAVLNG